jgi:hypothetical protein
MKYLLIILALAIGMSMSTGVAYMDQISPPEYNLPWGAKEDIELRTPTSRIYDLPDGQKTLIARRMTEANIPMVSADVTPFATAVGSDDGTARAIISEWPPEVEGCSDTLNTITSVIATKAFNGVDSGEVNNALMRWDTSSIDDAATVTDATFSYTLFEAIVDTDDRSVDGEYYDASNWPIDCADWISTVGTDAFSEDLTTVASPITLGTLSSINLTGYTALRLGISGGEPTGTNRWRASSFEGADDLILTVTFNVLPPDLILQATGVADGVHELRVEYDGDEVLLYVDDVLEDSSAGLDIVNNSNDWEMFTGNAMPYVEFVEFYLDTVLVLWYQFDTIPNLLLEDRSPGTNDIIARYPDTPFGVETILLPLTSGDGAQDGSGSTVGTTGSTPSSDFTAGGIPPLGGLTPGEGANTPVFNNLFDAPKVLIFKMAEFAGVPYIIGLIILAYIVTCAIGVAAYAAFRKGWIMYVAMLIGSMFAIFYGDGIWGWIVPITFAGLCAPFIVKEMRT